jgi:enoyl-CoA hydratase/carnithine racemase
MARFGEWKELGVELEDFVATVEIQRGPYNYFDHDLIAELADAFEALDAEVQCRAVVLAAEGRAFCAGARLGGTAQEDAGAAQPMHAVDGESADPGESLFRRTAGRLYVEAVRLFRTRKPIVGAIHGAAVGGGLGLALVPDLRVTCEEARFSANFVRLGIHPGFGLTCTLPELIGPSRSRLMLLTGRRVKGAEAVAMGLADLLVPQAEVRSVAVGLAREIAESAPLATVSVRETVRQGLAERVRAATDRELAEQEWLIQTQDSAEGIRAMAERRTPEFVGK